MKLLNVLLSILSVYFCSAVYAAADADAQKTLFSFSCPVNRVDKKTRFLTYHLVVQNKQATSGDFVMFGHDDGRNIQIIEKPIKAADLSPVYNTLLLQKAGLKDARPAMEELSALGYPTWQELQWEKL